MTIVKAMNDEIEIVFRKRSMKTFLLESKIHRVLEVDQMQDETERIFASNFATFMSRTDDVRVCVDKPSQNAIDWQKFFQYTRGKDNYIGLFEAYTEALDLIHNNEWHDAYTRYESSDPALLGDRDLLPPEMLSDEQLADEGVKKNELSTEPVTEQL